MNTHETYVSLEVAMLLKQAGFDWNTYNGYNENGKFADKCRNLIDWNDFDDFYSAPPLAVAQRWLREVKGYILEITAVRQNPDDVYKTYIGYWYNIFEEGKCGHYDTYEEALEAGIKKVLEIILEKRE